MIAPLSTQLKRRRKSSLLTLALALFCIALGVSATHAQQDPFSELLKVQPQAMSPSQQQRVSTGDSDGAYIRRALSFALELTPSGTETTWENPSTGHHGTIVPSRAFKTGTGRDCREFERTTVAETTVAKYQGTYCREPTGVWTMRDESLVATTSIEQAHPPAAGSYRPTTGKTKETQRLLAQLGFDPGPVDGGMGPRTRSAIEAFQRQQGLPVDGKVSETLLAQLEITRMGTRTTGGAREQAAKRAGPPVPAPLVQPPLTAAEDTQPPVIDVPATIAAKGAVAAISGRIRDASRLIEVTIDGRPVAVGADGSFSARRGVPQGTSTITIVALDEWGNRAERSVTLTRESLATRIPAQV